MILLLSIHPLFQGSGSLLKAECHDTLKELKQLQVGHEVYGNPNNNGI